MSDEHLILGIIVATAIIFVLLSGTLGILYVAYRSRLRQQATLATARIAYEQELRVIATEVSEQTLTSVGRELHDNVCNRLVVLNAHLEVFGLKNPDAASALKPATDALAQAYSQARLLSHSLNSDMVTSTGLRIMIEKEVERLQALGERTVHWQHDGGEPNLSPDSRLVAFRILQEAVSNTLKHAPGAAIAVELRSAPHFGLTIKDEGPGFDINAETIVTGSGMQSMQRRAALAGMRCSIQSTLGKGTAVLLDAVTE
jgi:two-component system NarL family sensor kinase